MTNDITRGLSELLDALTENMPTDEMKKEIEAMQKVSKMMEKGGDITQEFDKHLSPWMKEYLIAFDKIRTRFLSEFVVPVTNSSTYKAGGKLNNALMKDCMKHVKEGTLTNTDAKMASLINSGLRHYAQFNNKMGLAITLDILGTSKPKYDKERDTIVVM